MIENFLPLERRLDDLEHARAQLPRAILAEELCATIVEIARMLGANREPSVAELERRLVAAESIDIQSLRAAVDMVRPTPARPVASVLKDDAEQVRRELIADIEILEQKGHVFGPVETGLRLEIGVDPKFEYLLLCAVEAGSIEPALLALVEKKLALLDDEQVSVLWAKLCAEFDVPRFRAGLPRPPKIVPRGFLRYGTRATALKRMARFAVFLRQELRLYASQQGQQHFPAVFPGPGRILAWSGNRSVETITFGEGCLERALGRLAFYWEHELQGDPKELAAALRLPPESRLLHGPSYDAARRHLLKGTDNGMGLLIFEAKSILRLATTAGAGSGLELSLLNYKLGQEVMSNELRKQYQKLSEEGLQRRLCRFLIEQGYFAFGVKFGPSEVDLVVEEHPDAFAIETKLYRDSSGPRSALLRKAVVQLASYMDQAPRNRRGVLLIYNLSDVLIAAPKRWIHERYWVLPVNLMDTPSRRHRLLDIREAQGPEIIEVLKIEPQRESRRRSGGRARRKTGRQKTTT
jgi:hypothetical protein